MRSTALIGMAKVCADDSTRRLFVVESVRGNVTEMRVPRPSAVSMPICPFTRRMFSRTTSMPTPRPDTSVTVSFVESPE